MLPFGVTIPATVPQGSEFPEGLMNNPVYCTYAVLATLPSKFPHPNAANSALLIVVVMLPAKHKI